MEIASSYISRRNCGTGRISKEPGRHLGEFGGDNMKGTCFKELILGTVMKNPMLGAPAFKASEVNAGDRRNRRNAFSSTRYPLQHFSVMPTLLSLDELYLGSRCPTYLHFLTVDYRDT